MARLIVNADDLGYTGGIDQAIFALREANALSSATAMARGPSLARSLPNRPRSMAVGCHVVLVDGSPAAPPGEVASLLEGSGFRLSLPRFLLDLQRGRIRDRDIEQEAVAQIRSLQALGVQLTHIDTHKHTHLFARVLRPLLRAALACGIGAIRNPFEPAWARAATGGAPFGRRVQLGLLARYRAGFLREADRAGVRTTAGALGVLATGTLDAPTLERLLRALEKRADPGECYELVCHPGFHDAALDAARTRLRSERERERAALLAAIPQWTGEDGPHTLVSFADL